MYALPYTIISSAKKKRPVLWVLFFPLKLLTDWEVSLLYSTLQGLQEK